MDMKDIIYAPLYDQEEIDKVVQSILQIVNAEYQKVKETGFRICSISIPDKIETPDGLVNWLADSHHFKDVEKALKASLSKQMGLKCIRIKKQYINPDFFDKEPAGILLEFHW